MFYPDRLRKLKLPTLAYRRIRSDMIEIYKLLHGKYDRNTSNIINLCKDHNKLNEMTRGHMWKICHERSRLNLRKESFPNRAVNMWIFLPEYVVNAPIVDSFKNRLDKQRSNEEIVYDYTAAAPAGRKIYEPVGTQDLTIEAKCSCLLLFYPSSAMYLTLHFLTLPYPTLPCLNDVSSVVRG